MVAAKKRTTTTTTITIEVEVTGDAGAAYNAIDAVLDNGTFQDAVAEYARDIDTDAKPFRIVSVVSI